jgi:hypothetical protein
MASKYYNPRLASIAGAAQGKPYVSATPSIEKAFAKFDRVLEIKRREKILQQKENDKQIADIYYTNQKFLQILDQKGKYIPEKHKSGLLQGYAGQLKKITIESKDPNIARADSLIMQQTALSNLNKIDDSYKKISIALKPTAELIESKGYDADLVDPKILENYKKLVNGNWTVDSYGDNGYEKILFEGSDEPVDIATAIENASLIPDQSELHSTITSNMIDASEEFKKGNYPIEVFKDKINNQILSGPLDYKTALSLAGKIGLGGEDNIDLKRLALASREDNDFSYEDVEIDEEGNFQPTGKIISGENGLIEAVKDHYRKAAANYAKQFENQRIEKEAIDGAKDKKEPNDFAILGEDIATNIIKDPVSQFEEFSNAPIKYDKLNKIITIETGEDKEGNKLPSEKFNLNKKSDYLRFMDILLLNSSYTASERSKILNSARNWVNERSNMFETKSTDTTSSDLLGLPTFN